MKYSCLLCKKIFYAKKNAKRIYCSRRCFGLTHRGKDSGVWVGNRITTNCEYCKKKFTCDRTNRKCRFCCYKHYIKFVYKTPAEKKIRQRIYWEKYWNNSVNQKRKSESFLRRRIENKRIVLHKYSTEIPKCKCCGELEEMFLTIDHINGGGGKERKRFNNSHPSYYRWLALSPKMPGYQVLCFNCNIVKGFNKICPHQKKK